MRSAIKVRRCTVVNDASFEDVYGSRLVLPAGSGLVECVSEGIPVRGVTVDGRGPFDIPEPEFHRLVKSGKVVIESE
jgi:hypothetical protein